MDNEGNNKPNKEILQESIKKRVDPVIVENKRRHSEELASVGITILESLSGLKRVDNSTTEYDDFGLDIIHGLPRKEVEYEFDRILDSGLHPSFTMKHSEVIKALHSNIEVAYDKHRDMDLFEQFISHLSSEDAIFTNFSKLKLHKYAEANPVKLIELLKTLVSSKDFKGKCEVCSYKNRLIRTLKN